MQARQTADSDWQAARTRPSGRSRQSCWDARSLRRILCLGRGTSDCVLKELSVLSHVARGEDAPNRFWVFRLPDSGYCYPIQLSGIERNLSRCRQVTVLDNLRRIGCVLDWLDSCNRLARPSEYRPSPEMMRKDIPRRKTPALALSEAMSSKLVAQSTGFLAGYVAADAPSRQQR
jgi:hypothetical protein